MNKQARDIKAIKKKDYFRRNWRNEIISEAISILIINYVLGIENLRTDTWSEICGRNRSSQMLDWYPSLPELSPGTGDIFASPPLYYRKTLLLCSGQSMRKVPWVHTPTSILHWKVAVPEAIDYLGVSPGLAVLSRVLQACGYGGRAAAVARGDNGRRPHRGGVHHRAGCAELHPGAAGRRDDQHRSAVVPEATGRLGHVFPPRWPRRQAFYRDLARS